MTGQLEGKHVLITGGGSGIGLAAAHELTAMGAIVTLVGRSGGRLTEAAGEIAAAGGEARIEVADVTDAERMDAVAERAHRHTPLWGCVCSAGVNRPGPTVDTPISDFDLVMATNVRGTFVTCQVVGRRLLSAGVGGRILNISSQMGSVGYPGRAVYCASKHAVDGLTRALAVEWSPHGITVNAVAPTFIETPFTAPMLADPEFRSEVLSRIPAGRLGTLDEVAAAIGFLMTPRASLVTGHVLLTDGGWTAW